ncbi:MAG TPA: hypothetical protein VGF06_14805 [Terriglobales bacterium]
MPSVTFTLDFPGSDPSHYVISISSDNHASYQSNGRLSSKYASQEGEPFELTFTASPQLAQQIFALARKANYFQGEIETRKHGLASTGAKTLAYRDGERNTQAVYNYSPLVPVQELTRIFQSLSSTLEFGRRLEYCYRYQKLALDDELKNMEGFAKSGDLQDLSAVAPILQKIADDPSVINPVRYRARRLLAQAGSPPAGQ